MSIITSSALQASEFGYSEYIKILLKSGANINTKDSTGSTTLIWAKHLSKFECVKLLEKCTKKKITFHWSKTSKTTR